MLPASLTYLHCYPRAEPAPFLRSRNGSTKNASPADEVYASQLGSGDARWYGHPSVLTHLKKRAKELGIWNMFLPKNHFANEGSPGFTNLEYGLMAEQLGKRQDGGLRRVTALRRIPGIWR